MFLRKSVALAIGGLQQKIVHIMFMILEIYSLLSCIPSETRGDFFFSFFGYSDAGQILV